VHANSVTVHGFVKARIHADDKVDLMDGGEIQGDIYTSRLRIADGGMFEGRCSMIDADNAADLFSLPASELKAVLRSKPAPVPDADEADTAKAAPRSKPAPVPDADKADTAKAVLRSKPAPVPDTDKADTAKAAPDAPVSDTPVSDTGVPDADKADAPAADNDADETDTDAQESADQTEADGE
jgi:hypothetical protein